MTNIQERLKRIIGKLSETERDEEGIHIRSSIEQRRNKSIKEKDKLLDTLARLLTDEKKDVCVAICCYDNQLLLSSNRGEMNYAKEVFALLKRLAQDKECEETYISLMNLSIKKIYSLNINNSALRKKRIDGSDFWKSVEEYYDGMKWKEKKLKLEQLETINKHAEKLHNEIRELQEKEDTHLANKFWDYLIPLDDINKVIETIKKEELDGEIFEAIKRGKIKYIAGKICENRKNCRSCKSCRDQRICERKKDCKKCKICEENAPHAEMKIINEIYSSKEKKDYQYIGITKLTCCPCYIAIEILNGNSFYDSLHSRGTHGGTYPNWAMPNNFSEKEKEEIVERLENVNRKGRETTSEIPQTMSNPGKRTIERVTDTPNKRAVSEEMQSEEFINQIATPPISNSRGSLN